MAVSQRRDNYAAMHRGFGWRVPAHFNIAQVCCTAWARRPDARQRVAVRAHGLPPGHDVLTFADLQAQANRLCNLLRGPYKPAEYGPVGIRANAVLPGLILDYPTSLDAPHPARDIAERYPVGHPGHPHDVAEAVRYLASDAARFISGAALVVDGGMTARSPEWSAHGSLRR